MAEVRNPTSDLSRVRERFSSLQDGFAFLDAPGGSQVPDEVGDAIAHRGIVQQQRLARQAEQFTERRADLRRLGAQMMDDVPMRAPVQGGKRVVPAVPVGCQQADRGTSCIQTGGILPDPASGLRL